MSVLYTEIRGLLTPRPETESTDQQNRINEKRLKSDWSLWAPGNTDGSGIPNP